MEEKFSNLLNINYSLGVANCTVALHLGLLLLGIGEGDEVITPSLTFVATVNAIRYVRAIPVFCDIKGLDDLTIDPNKIENLLTKKTKAIIVMHYGGYPCDMDKIMSIAKKYDLKVLEDSSHGPLSEYNGKKLGTIGDIGCFSFFSNKNISTGEGGMLVTNNRNFYEKGKLLRSHGMTSLSYERSKGHKTDYDVIELGFNYRIDDIRAAIAIEQLKKLPNDIEKRKIIRDRYIENLESEEKIVIPFINSEYYVSNYIFPLVIKNSNNQLRNYIRKQLQSAGIQSSVHYPSINRFSIYKKYDRGGLLNAEYVSDNEITLPMHGKLSNNEVDYISSKIKSILQEL